MNGGTRWVPLQVQPEPPDVLRLAGWAFIAGSLVVFAYILLPPQPMDAEWEFSAMLRLTDNALLPLLGLALVLHGRSQELVRWQLTAFRALVVFALGLALFFLALVPLAAGDARRVEAVARNRIVVEGNSWGGRMRKVEKQVRQATSLDQLRVLGMLLAIKPAPPEKAQSPSAEIESLRKRLGEQIAFTRADEARKLLEQHEAVKMQIAKDRLKVVAMSILASWFYFCIGLRNIGLFRQYVLEPE